MESAKLLTIAQTAELLNCSQGFVRKRIALTEANEEGGWPKTIFVNLQPNGIKSLYRIKQEALVGFLTEQSEQANIEESAEAAPTGACTL